MENVYVCLCVCVCYRGHFAGLYKFKDLFKGKDLVQGWTRIRFRLESRGKTFNL